MSWFQRSSIGGTDWRQVGNPNRSASIIRKYEEGAWLQATAQKAITEIFYGLKKGVRSRVYVLNHQNTL
jgi:hypothetical protein